MAEHLATITWINPGSEFLSGRYSREHTWSFDGGLSVPASPAPSVVPPPLSNPANIDPEEAYVASLASCHMLTFLYVAQKAGFAVASYTDTARGIMGKTDRGVPWVEKVVLQPQVDWSAAGPDAAKLEEMHELAHAQCFIANSVRTTVVVEPHAA